MHAAASDLRTGRAFVALILATAMILTACAHSSPEDGMRPPGFKPSASRLPYGLPVPGKPGYVRSPYRPEAAAMNVKGRQPGQQVRDPVAHKDFLLP